MAITLGTFTKFDNGAFTGTLKTLHVTAPVSIVPVDKISDKAPDHRVYAGQRHEIGAGWSQVAKSSGETYLNLKIGAPEALPTSLSGSLATSSHRSPAAGHCGGAFALRSTRRPCAPMPHVRPGDLSRRYFHCDMPERAASRMRGAPNLAGRKERAGTRRFIVTSGKIGTPAPRCAAPAASLTRPAPA
jgi:uncharacterized protein (DUF736 family)